MEFVKWCEDFVGVLWFEVDFLIFDYEYYVWWIVIFGGGMYDVRDVDLWRFVFFVEFEGVDQNVLKELS